VADEIAPVGRRSLCEPQKTHPGRVARVGRARRPRVVPGGASRARTPDGDPADPGFIPSRPPGLNRTPREAVPSSPLAAPGQTCPRGLKNTPVRESNPRAKAPSRRSFAKHRESIGVRSADGDPSAARSLDSLVNISAGSPWREVELTRCPEGGTASGSGIVIVESVLRRTVKGHWCLSLAGGGRAPRTSSVSASSPQPHLPARLAGEAGPSPLQRVLPELGDRAQRAP